MYKKLNLVPILLLAAAVVHGQTPGASPEVLPSLPARYLDKVGDEAGRMDKAFTSGGEKYLREMAAEEVRLQKKLQKLDPAAANGLFGNIAERYGQLQTSLHAAAGQGIDHSLATYIPSLDTLKNTLQFLKKYKDGPDGIKLAASLEKVQGLQTRLGAAEQLKNALEQRRQYLQEQLGKYGMMKDLEKMKGKIAGYKQQLQDYRQSLQDPSRLRQKAITALSGLPAYQHFMRQNSFLASLFGQPDSYQLSDSSLKGLQTRALVQQTIREKIGTGGSHAEQKVMQQVQDGTGQLSRLKASLTALGGKGMPTDPGAGSNSRKPRTFWRHIEYGADLQFQRPNNLLPVMADLALTLGYRLNDKGTVGVGLASKIGLGNGIQDIHISGQGAGIRSYLDWKWKKNLYLTGGYEWNYLSQFRSVSQLENLSCWQHSGLIGLSKKYRVSAKVQGKMQLLFDFLSYYQIPRSQPILFRVGWAF